MEFLFFALFVVTYPSKTNAVKTGAWFIQDRLTKAQHVIARRPLPKGTRRNENQMSARSRRFGRRPGLSPDPEARSSLTVRRMKAVLGTFIRFSNDNIHNFVVFQNARMNLGKHFYF
jgi:hypothetical protein